LLSVISSTIWPCFSAALLQPISQPRQQRFVLQRRGGELDEERGVQALAFARLQRADGLVEHPAIDRAVEVVLSAIGMKKPGSTSPCGPFMRSRISE
jgi:hypothetical protein